MAEILTRLPDEDEAPDDLGGVREPRRPRPAPRQGGEAVAPERETEPTEAEGIRVSA